MLLKRQQAYDPKEAVGEAVGVSAFFFFTASLGEAVGVLLPP